MTLETTIPPGPWYHEFTLPNGTKIDGWDQLSPYWEMVRTAMKSIDYQDKRVLDLASRDGMWAFEAEKRGAKTVVATDIGDEHFINHITWLKTVFDSKIIIHYNVPAGEVSKRLDMFFKWNSGSFDIVQHLGLLYHLPDMMASLSEANKVLNVGGHLILETSIYLVNDFPLARFNSDSGVYSDARTYWAPNEKCLTGMLHLSGFDVLPNSIQISPQNSEIGRVCLIAQKRENIHPDPS